MMLPNGVNMTVYNKTEELTPGETRNEKAVTSTGPMISTYNTHVMDSIIFFYSVIYWNENLGSQAAEVVFHWCVETYDAAFENNVLSMQRNLSHTQSHRVNASYLEMLSPADEDTVYPVDQTRVPEIGEILRDATTGNAFISNKTRTGGERLQGVINEIRSLDTTPTEVGFALFSEAITDMAEKYGTIIVNTYFSSSKLLPSSCITGLTYCHLGFLAGATQI